MPDLIAGKRIAAVAMTEADAGSDLAGMRCHARRDGDDWVLNGSKMFITNGVHGDVVLRRRQDRRARTQPRRCRCSSSRRARPASASPGR